MFVAKARNVKIRSWFFLCVGGEVEGVCWKVEVVMLEKGGQISRVMVV